MVQIIPGNTKTQNIFKRFHLTKIKQQFYSNLEKIKMLYFVLAAFPKFPNHWNLYPTNMKNNLFTVTRYSLVQQLKTK